MTETRHCRTKGLGNSSRTRPNKQTDPASDYEEMRSWWRQRRRAKMEGRSLTLELTPEEASKLLCLCMLSPGHLDNQAESALRKLAQFIREKDRAAKSKTSASPGAN